MSVHRIVHPEGWPPAKGYANAVVATGRTIWIAGQIGRDQAGNFGADLPAQLELALRNIVAVLASAGAAPEHVVRLTWFVVDVADYSVRLNDIGDAYRRVMGRNFPAMSVVEITRLVESDALIEVEATAVLPEGGGRHD